MGFPARDRSIGFAERTAAQLVRQESELIFRIENVDITSFLD
jgi:hypothetical protein